MFCNRKKDKLKILFRDYNGFWFYYRRLEKGLFDRPDPLELDDFEHNPSYDYLHRQLLQEELLHADETGLQILDEPDKTTQSKSYMWLYRTSGVSKKPMVLFNYRVSRSSENPKDFLKGYEGYLNVDGYAGYESA
ncbi:hypothetical protein QOZ98_001228 [Planomicrobium stackebrandtii]|uniref:Transposase IS66 central domain-containing protein n=1 Tax=Planomicrobium stackebrandtii TaxID=253160 RepID=A0ABU0GSS0_9BACL|nr:hypothetical protein [Planomicrobium stackebrandtii]